MEPAAVPAELAAAGSAAAAAVVAAESARSYPMRFRLMQTHWEQRFARFPT